MKMKRIFLLLLVFLSAVNAYSKNNLTENEKKLLNVTLEKRCELRSYDTAEESLKEIKLFYEQIKNDPAWKNSSEQIQLASENMIISAVYNCLYAIDIKHPDLKKTITDQYDKVVAFNEKHNDLDPWYVFSSYEVINSSMQFLPQAQAMKIGLKEKDEYDSIIKENNDMVYGLVAVGLWYFFAPAIGGGSNKKAGEYFKQAVDLLNDNYSSYEKFYSYIYYSQYLYEIKETQECKVYLNKAKTLFKDSHCSYIDFIEKINNEGYSILYYTMNREKVDKKLGLSK